VKKTAKSKTPGDGHEKEIEVKLIENLDDIEKVILKRSLLEEWVDLHINDFIKAVKGYFVKCYYQGKERIALIVDARDEDQDSNPTPVYVLGKKKTGY
jgi:hypothetical protein